MRTTLHVLSVGTSEQSARICEALLARQKCHLIAVQDARELSSLPCQERIEVAVLHATMGKGALRQSARTIRRQWPHAHILLLGAQPEILDASLYEERLSPASSSGTLLAMIELLAATSRRCRLHAPTWVTSDLPHMHFNTICVDAKEVRTQP